jgi:hypothetical protein
MDAGTNTIQRFKNKITENEQETVCRGEGGNGGAMCLQKSDSKKRRLAKIGDKKTQFSHSIYVYTDAAGVD